MIRSFSVRDGAAGTLQTLKMMLQLSIQGATMPAAQEAARRWNPEQWEELLRSKWDYVEEQEETIRMPYLQFRTLLSMDRMIGDCDDAAVVAATVAAAGGYPFRFVAIRMPANGNFSHVFVEVQDGHGNWVRVDPTAPVNTDYRGCERMVLAGDR